MKTCETCKVVMDDGATFCPGCGRHVGTGLSDTQSRVNALLTEANLHRIRGEYDAAIDKCTDALRLQPSDADVHSMIGDVYESEGRLDEAARWYQMAIDLRPESALDSAKLERILPRLKRIRRMQRDVNTGSWTRAFLVDGWQGVNLRKIVIFCTICVLLLLAFGAMAWYLRIRGESVSRAQLQKQIPPHVEQPDSVNKDSPQQPQTSTTPQAVTQPPNEPLPRPIVEQQILSNLATNPAIHQRHLMVEDVKVDPRNGALLVTVRLPEPASPLTRVQALRQAAVVAAAAYSASPNATSVTIRALVTVQSEYAAGEPRLALICDAARQVGGLDVNTAPADQLYQSFKSIWWGPELPE